MSEKKDDKQKNIRAIFNKKTLENKYKGIFYSTTKETDINFNSKKSQQIKEIFNTWHQRLSDTKETEEQLRPDFFRYIFQDILGYLTYQSNTEFNFKVEQSTEIDKKTPDAILGFFNKDKQDVRAIAEMKSPNVDLDKKQNRKDFQGSPVEQAFSYVSKYQGVEWVIVSNCNEIRLYSARYQGEYYSIKISDIANLLAIDKMEEFYYIFCKNNLIATNTIKQLVEDKKKEEKEITDKFYAEYNDKREDIIKNLHKTNEIDFNLAINKTQKLFDRLIFIRFCESRGLIEKSFESIQTLLNLDNSIYDAWIQFFSVIDKGSKNKTFHKFNGGLFKKDDEFDRILKLIPEQKLINLTNFFKDYNFKENLSVHILGHIFEQSISDLEKFKAQLNNESYEVKDSSRKEHGVFYTPEYITQYIVKEAIESWLIDKTSHLTQPEEISEEELRSEKPNKPSKKKEQAIFYYKEYFKILSSIKVLDPACGSGAFLVEIFRFLKNKYEQIAEKIAHFQGGLYDTEWNYIKILQNNIYGVDINFESVQISKLSLWLETVNKNDELTTLDNNIKCGNSLIDDPKIAGDKAFKWEEAFKEVFATGGFDVVVGNPPYVGQKGNSELFIPFQKLYPEFYERLQDLYYYFIYKGLSLLNQNGYISFITPPYFLTATSAINLRKEILKNEIKSFLEIKANVFDSASIHSLIFLFKKYKANKNNFNVYQLEKEKSFIKTYNQNGLTQDNWYILGSAESIDIKIKCKTLGEIAKISPGIQTGFDKAYIIQKEELSKFNDEERKFIKKFYKNSHIQRYLINESDQYIILASKIDNIEKYPNIKDKISQYKEILSKRNINFALKKSYAEGKWWHFQTYRPSVDFEGEKIVLPYRSSQNNFVVSKDEFYSLTDIYYITILNNNYNIEFLNIILNSKFIYSYLLKNCKRKGDIIEYGIGAVNAIPIPQIPLADQTPLITHAQKMLDLTKQFNELSNKFTKLLSADLGVAKITKKLEKWYNLTADEFFAEVGKQNKNLSLSQKSQWLEHFEAEKQKALALQNQITQTDAEIDKMVYTLYNLTEEEIKVIDGVM